MLTATSVALEVLYFSVMSFRSEPGPASASQVNGLGEAETDSTWGAAGESVVEVVGGGVVFGSDVLDVPGLVVGVLDVFAVLVGACAPLAELAAVAP